MGKKLPDAADTRANQQKRHLRWIQVRRRIIGALAVAAVAAVVLQLGDIKKPPTIVPPELPVGQIAKPKITPDLQDARRRLKQTPEIAKPSAKKSKAAKKSAAKPTVKIAKPGATPPSEPIAKPSAAVAKPVKKTAKPAALKSKDVEEATELEKVAALFFDNADSPKADSDSAKSTASKSDGKFVVQIGAFLQTKRAKEIVIILRKKSYQVTLEEVVVNNEKLTRVRVAGYASRAEAERARQELVALGYTEAIVNDLR